MKQVLKRSLSLLLTLTLVLGVVIAASMVAYANPYPQYNYYNSATDYQIACTWYAWKQANERLGLSLPSWGNAGNWYSAAGYPKGSEPRVNAIACFSYTNSPPYGHVAYVTGVNSDGSFNIVEGGSGWSGNNHGVCSRTIRRGTYWPDQGFIYLQPTNTRPDGHLDNLSGGAGTVTVRGWAYDPDEPSKSIGIHVYIGGPAGSSGAECINLGNTDDYRPDVAYGGNNYHGFNKTITTSKRGSQPVYVYALDTQYNDNPCIGSGTVTINSPTYTLTYNANGGTGAPASQTGSGSITLSTAKPTRSGYTFKGWATSAGATTAQYSAGASYNLTGNATLYAVWQKNATPAQPTVKAVALGDVTINYKATTTLKPQITADEGAKYTVSYFSSNPNVASVDANGKVTGVKKGTAVITCTVTNQTGNTVSDTCTVTVSYTVWQWIIKILLFGWLWY